MERNLVSFLLYSKFLHHSRKKLTIDVSREDWTLNCYLLLQAIRGAKTKVSNISLEEKLESLGLAGHTTRLW